MADWQITDVQKALKGADYPASGDELARLAEDNGADGELVEKLRDIGEATGPDDVMREFKGQVTGR
jgi:Protein of unknown function (DUF2795)